MRSRKLTPERLNYVRTVIAVRKALPTHAELAIREGISKSLVDQIASGLCYKGRSDTNVQHILVELGLVTPQNQP